MNRIDNPKLDKFEAEIKALREELAEVKKSEKHLKEALRLSPMALCHHDKELRYVWLYNPHMGFNAEDVLGKTDWDILDQDLADRMGVIKKRVLETGVGERVEMPTKLGDENSEYFDLVVEPIVDEATGEAVGLSCSGIDVTEDRRVRENYRQSKKLAETANVAKTKFLAAASHDLRQPLQAIRMFAGALRRRLQAEPVNDIAKCIEATENIDLAIDSLGSLLNSLLDISKLDSGTVQINPKVCALGDLFSETKKTFDARAVELDLDFRVVSTSKQIKTDPVHLQLLITNLVSNALRYTETGKILLGCRQRGDKLWIEVWDTGIGIPEDHRERIFDEFYQIGNPMRQREKGLGLGLAIVQRTAKLLNHDLRVTSKLGQGSVFSVEVPLIAGTSYAQPGEGAPPKKAISARTIMIVEDDVVVMEATKFFLSSFGHTVYGLASASEALNLIKGKGVKPDLLIVDYQLPDGRTGLGLYEVAAKTLGYQVPGILMTGDIAPAHLEKFKNSGLLHLAKPIDTQALNDYIDNLLV